MKCYGKDPKAKAKAIAAEQAIVELKHRVKVSMHVMNRDVVEVIEPEVKVVKKAKAKKKPELIVEKAKQKVKAPVAVPKKKAEKKVKAAAPKKAKPVIKKTEAKPKKIEKKAKKKVSKKKAKK